MACLDPYHDDQLRLTGLPDVRSNPSVVQVHNQSYTLRRPSEVDEDSNWNASVVFTGFDSQIDNVPELGQSTTPFALKYTLNSLGAVTQGEGIVNTKNKFGTVNVLAGLDSEVLSYAVNPSTLPANRPPPKVRHAFGSMIGSDRGRLIAIGIEVHNNTAEVYKQGSVTTAMLPENLSDVSDVMYVDVVDQTATPQRAPSGWRSVQCDSAASLAHTTADLIAIPTAGTWRAADGVYMIPRLGSVPTNASRPGSSSRGIIAEDDETYPNNAHYYFMPYPSKVVGTNPALPEFSGLTRNHFTPMQSFFSGLSPQTSLTITVRTIIEYFPDIDSPLLALALPSCSYDPYSFVEYSRIVKKAPYAVKVDMNAMGDYFRIISRIIKETTPVFSSLFPSVSPLIGAGSELAQRALGFVESKLAKRKQTTGAAKPKIQLKVIKRGKPIPKGQAGPRNNPSQ